jgi:omega-6 fatty acid desaturase (delta-12 desaturase)
MHALHHSTSGNLEKRGYGDIETMTVREYESLTPMGRLRYRFYRNPLISLFIGPPVHFLILQRFALGSQASIKQVWKSLLIHNAGLIALYGGLSYLLGWPLMLQVVLPVILVATWIGGWLFFVQHQFEETLWDGADEWDIKIAALKGSSHLVLPPVLNWFTCDIGLHHIHHLCSRIPNYRLRECMNANSDLQTIAPRLTFTEALLAFRFALWDEAARSLISFRAYGRKLRTMGLASAES